MTEPLLEVEGLTIQYRTRNEPIQAVTDATFTIDENEYFGLVGESGSGKSTLAKSIIGGLDSNGEIVSGKIKYRGKEIQDYSEKQLSEEIRWKEISYIPQASMNSLDPIERLSKQAVELAKRHTDWGKERTIDRLSELFNIVGLPSERIYDYPHEFSGGMQQRAIIAMALLLKPSLVIADEPTTALDVIMQDQILKHLHDIKDEYDLSMVFITHDISVIFENCDSLAVLHGGQISEIGSADTIYNEPRHPYSILLQQAFPDVRYPDRDLEIISGKPPELRDDVNYCTFVERCPWAVEGCRSARPALESVENRNEHKASCIRKDEMEELAAESFTGNDRTEESIIGEAHDE